jgi:uncharacterized membrane protein (DUF2068 family)
MRTNPSDQRSERTLGLKLIIAYKLTKAIAVFGLAIWLTFAPHGAYHFAEHLVRELSAGGALWVRLGRWLDAHLSMRLFHQVTFLAWLDAITTGLEAFLLLIGKAWGEWLVVIGVGALLVPEVLSLERRPSWGRFLVLLVNAAVVLYLLQRRLRATRRSSSSRRSSAITVQRGAEDPLER